MQIILLFHIGHILIINKLIKHTFRIKDQINASKTCFCSGLNILHCWAIFLMISTVLESKKEVFRILMGLKEGLCCYNREQTERRSLPGNCLDTIGCCCRTYLIYPFRGLLGGPLGRELRFFSVLL